MKYGYRDTLVQWVDSQCKIKLSELAKMSANSSGSGSLLEKGKKGKNQIQKLEESLVNIKESIKLKMAMK